MACIWLLGDALWERILERLHENNLPENRQD